MIGCGVYVDNEVGAPGSTGRGEECIFINGAHTVVEMMRRGMPPTEAAMEAIKRVAARYDNDQNELKVIDINFYAVNKRGEYGSATLWKFNGEDGKDSAKGAQFTLHDGLEAKYPDCTFLFERRPA